MGVLVGHSSPLGVAVEMRGLGLVAVLLCVALVLGQRQTGKKPSKGKLLSPPVPRKCSARPKRFKYQGHNYFYSGDVAPYKKIKYDWLDGRNFCREYCMDLVSLETQQENDYVVVFLLGLQRNQVHTIFPAEVAAIQPVIFDFLIGSDIATIKVVVALILEPLWSCRALPRNWGGEQLAFAGLLACLSLS